MPLLRLLIVVALTWCLGSPAYAAEPDVPFVPTESHLVEAMLDLAKVGPGDMLIDLGSGDGRIPIAAGRRGARALGIEIDPGLVARARGYANGEGVGDKVRFRSQDLFEAPLREASVVTLYLLPEINLRLRPKLLTELRPGTRVVSHAFTMGDWRPDEQRVVEGKTIYLWLIPAIAGGTWQLTLADGSTHLVEIEQRFQEIGGTFGRQRLANAHLRGTSISFTSSLPGGTLTFRGIVGDTAIQPDPGASAGAATGWMARRI